jgi:YidC/Oxa1 family membrane protein insertase
VNETRNVILAVVLSGLVLLGWTMLSDRFFPSEKPATHEVAPAAQPQPAQPQPQAAQQPRQKLQPVAQALASTPRVQIRTPSLQGSIDLKGARLDDLVLLKERQSIEKDSPPVRLLSPAGSPDAYFATFGWTGQGVQVPDENAVWTSSAPVLTPGNPVTLGWQNGTGQTFQLILSVDEDYLFTVRQKVTNSASAPVSLRPYGLVSRAEKSPDPSRWTMHVGPIGYLDGAAKYNVDWKDLDSRQVKRFDSNGGWIGFTDKYWLTALAPVGDAHLDASFTGTPGGGYQADYAEPQQVVAPGGTVQTDTRLFAGAKNKSVLDRYEDAGITKLSKSIDWGWFEWFMRPIFDLLNWLFQATGNFGVAIICLTIIVRLIMFPVAQKQFKSMAAMRKLQPKLKAIQERFKNDKAKQQQETLKLYQQEKINPAAGCLPIVLQVPVFYALYKVLMVSVEMRHQPFVLWIRDLSAPDPLTPVNLFGLLHFTPPGFLHIGVLALLLGITQWISFKLNPQQMDPTQQQIFSLMPWVMMFIMSPFAAGLLVYWVTNNILTVLQQWWLYRRFGLHLSDTHPVHS